MADYYITLMKTMTTNSDQTLHLLQEFFYKFGTQGLESHAAYPVLLKAIAMGRDDVVEFLLEQGLDPNNRLDASEVPALLHTLRLSPDKEQSIEDQQRQILVAKKIFHVLLKYGANPNLIYEAPKRQGKPVARKDALTFAITQQNVWACQTLLSAKADVGRKVVADEWGQPLSAFTWAAKESNACLALFLQTLSGEALKAGLDEMVTFGRLPILCDLNTQTASELKQLQDFWVQEAPDFGNLSEPAIALFKTLLNHKPIVGYLENRHMIKTQCEKLRTGIRTKSSPVIREIKNMVSMGIFNSPEAYPILLQAVESGCKGTVMSLLKAGLDPNLRFSDAVMPALTLAATTEQPEMIDLLLHYKADPNALYHLSLEQHANNGAESALKHPVTVLWHALCSENQVLYHKLLKAGADPNQICPFYLEEVQRDTQNNVAVKIRGGYYLTPLWVAACHGYTAIVQMLLECPDTRVETLLCGQNVNPRFVNLCSDSFTALMVAAQQGRRGVVQALGARGNINQCNENGNTALMLAVLGGDPGVVYSLIDNGADVHACNHTGKTTLMFAARWGHVMVMAGLLSLDVDPLAQDKNGIPVAGFVKGSLHQTEAMHALLKEYAKKKQWQAQQDERLPYKPRVLSFKPTLTFSQAQTSQVAALGADAIAPYLKDSSADEEMERKQADEQRMESKQARKDTEAMSVEPIEKNVVARLKKWNLRKIP